MLPSWRLWPCSTFSKFPIRACAGSPRPVDAVDDDVRALIDDMFDTMYDAHGIGLAATQVGVEQRVLVIDLQERADDADPEAPVVRNPQAFINPEILEVSDELSGLQRGLPVNPRAICGG